jgi:hypothetical protein
MSWARGRISQKSYYGLNPELRTFIATKEISYFEKELATYFNVIFGRAR